MAPFVLFGRGHLIAVALSLLIAAALIAITRARRETEKPIRLALAAVLIANWAWWYGLAYTNGWLTLGDALPMNLCDWATIAVLMALFHPNQRAYDLAYFWALCGTVQGMVTPDTLYDFPESRFLVFFIYHGGIIAAVLYLTFGVGLRPRARSLKRVILWSLGYLIAAGFVDFVLGTNYGFLRAKPMQATLFDFMAPWPYYIGELIVLGFVSAAAYYAPWFIADRLREHHPNPEIYP